MMLDCVGRERIGRSVEEDCPACRCGIRRAVRGDEPPPDVIARALLHIDPTSLQGRRAPSGAKVQMFDSEFLA